jgi:hypothetical protein
MSGTISTQDIYALLIPGAYSAQMLYRQWEDESSKLYKKVKSDREAEVFIHMKPLGEAREKSEGAPTWQDSMRVMWQFSAQHKAFGLQYDITYEAQRFNLYKQDFPQKMENLTASHRQTKNKRALDPLMQGFNPGAVTYDGQPLFSQNHPTAVGTYSNTIGTPTEYDEEAMEDVNIILAGMTDDAGKVIQAEGNTIFVSSSNRYNAARIQMSTDRPGTANREINAMTKLGDYPGGVVTNRYLPNDWPDWYVKTSINNGNSALHMVADELRIDPYVDEKTKIISAISYELYLFVITDNRQFFGIEGLA